jgi:hypothetical protein
MAATQTEGDVTEHAVWHRIAQQNDHLADDIAAPA